MGKMVKLWIQEAIKKPGALRETVKRRFGKEGFTSRGTIKVKILRVLAQEKGVTGQRARLALKLRSFKEKGKKAGGSLKSKAKKAVKKVKKKLKKALKSKKKKRRRRKKSKRSRKGRRKGRKR